VCVDLRIHRGVVMVLVRTAAKLAAAAVAVGFIVLTASSPSRLRAQVAPAPEYPMRLTADRALAFVRAADADLSYVPGEVLVKFRDGVSVAGQQRALRALRSRPSPSQLRWVGDVALWTDPAESDATILAAQLREQPEVEYAAPNAIYKLSMTPNDPGYGSRQWNLSAIDMPRAWDINPGGKAEVTVAVIDSGVTTVARSYIFQTWNGRATQNVVVPVGISPDFAAGRLVNPRDFIFWDGPVVDMDGHGTHVASTIGEDTNNLIAGAGIAYGASLMPLKVCVGYWEVQFALSASGYSGYVPQDSGGCAESEIADAIRYAADSGARVINMSLGGPMPSPVLKDALSYAVGKGAFVAISMGNAYDEGNPVEYPAAYAKDIPGVMSVGAVGRSLARAYYSSTGPHLEIAAPGGDFEDGGGSGLIWQATITPTDSDPAHIVLPRFDRYAEVAYQGTSMASPHVAGVAALLSSQGIDDPAAIEAVIKGTARFLGTADPATPGRNQEYGYGLVQPRAALRGLGVAR
jgi:serine protease